MARLFKLYFWMAIATISNFLVILIYTKHLGEFYAFVAFIIIVQSLATTLDFGLNSMLMRKSVEAECIDASTFSVLRAGELFLCIIWCVVSFIFIKSNLNVELVSSLDYYILLISFFLIPITRIFSQFQRTFLYATNRHVLATKSLAIAAILKLIIPLLFMNENPVHNITVYLVTYSVISCHEYAYLRKKNFKNLVFKYSYTHVQHFLREYRSTLMSLAFTSMVMSLSTQIEKSVLFAKIDHKLLTEVTHVLQLSSISLIIFGPVSQLLQPSIIRQNLRYNHSGLNRAVLYSFCCTVFFIFFVKTLEYTMIRLYPILFTSELSLEAISTFKFFSFLSVLHIQASITYFYNIGRNKLALQGPSMAFQLALDFLALVISTTTLETFIITFCFFRLISYNLFFFIRYVGELNMAYLKLFLVNMCATATLV